MPEDPLAAAALAVRQLAHAPYSRFPVGAALEDNQGGIHVGCNVESSSYGLTICAERCAVFSAYNQGARNFRRIVVATDTKRLTPPCGACRQVLWDLCGDIDVDLINLDGALESFRLRDLLPRAFDDTFLD